MSLLKKKFFRLKLPFLAFLIILGLIVAGWHLWASKRFIETTDDAYVGANITVISPKVSGYVSRIFVKENSRVKTGQILFTIEDREFATEVTRMKAYVGVNKAKIEILTAEIKLQKAFITQAKATVVSAKAGQVLAASNLERYTALQKDRAASRQKLDIATANAKKAGASIDGAEALFKAAKDKFAVLVSKRTQADARYQVARAELQLAKLNLDNTVIRAPVDGLLGNRHLGIGQYLRPGMQVFSLVPLPNVYVTANFKETQVAHMRIGQSVTLAVDSFPGQVIMGIVESFAPASGSIFSLLPAENATGNFVKIIQRIPVRIRILKNNPYRGALRPGMSVMVSVHINTGGNIPKSGQGLIESSGLQADKISLMLLDSGIGK